MTTSKDRVSAFVDEKDAGLGYEAGQPSEITTAKYPPQDTGLKAWLFLLGASIVEITAWGFLYCYGVFREYFFTHEPFQGASIVSTGGVLANGVLQISLPFIIYALNRFPNQRKNAMWLGCVICDLSPIGAAFTQTPGALVVCLGPLYGLGAGLLFAPSMHFMGDWFVKRKSFAYGIICGAGAAAGAGLPPVYRVCLNKYGYKVTLIGWGLVTFAVTTIGLLFMHSRTPPEKAPKPTRHDFDFLRKPLFLIFLAATVVQALAHYGPSVYLPSIGADFGLTSAQGPLLVSLLNLAQAIGQPLQGMLADTRASFCVPFILSTPGGGIESLLIWPFARNLWSLVVYSLAFGATAGDFAVLRPRFAAAVIREDATDTVEIPSENDAQSNELKQIDQNKSMLIFGIFTAARGIAILSSGFVTVALVNEESTDLSGYGLGARWRSLMIYTGITMTAASLGALGKFVRHDLKIRAKHT
ncbi:major facilitator superfamily domain-containing protein [Xylariaceae sp. FL0662B]|nr:major facilitator superfamily domain-containing protein [Xylariaceae sp. FL0662B]